MCKLEASAKTIAVIARGENGGFGRWLRCRFWGRQAIAHLAVRPDGDIALPLQLTRLRVSLGLL